MNMDKVQTLQGFRDYLPDAMRLRQQVIDTVRKVYELYGYEPLDTPALESASLLLGKYGDEEKLIYHFQDNGKREVALRYDLTVPLARVVANHPELPRPFKRYQAALAWRAESPQRGRYREFMQFDVDCVGTFSPVADAEMVLVMAAAMRALAINDFVIRLNHRGVLNGIMRALKIADGDVAAVVRQIDKADKIGGEMVVANITDIIGAEKAKALQEIVFEKNSDVLEVLEQRFGNDSEALEALANLKEIVGLLVSIKGKYIVDLSIVRGLDYYTGIVYETYLGKFPELGSVFSGGRYDKLMSKLAGVDLPAVGTSMGVDRLINALASTDFVASKPLFCIAVFSGFEKEAVELAESLRTEGLRVAMALAGDKLGKQMQYANNIGANVVIMLGENEIKQGIVVARNMESGEQQDIKAGPVEGLAKSLEVMVR